MISWTELLELDLTYMKIQLEREDSITQAYKARLKDADFHETVIVPILEALETKDYILRKNDYPYKVEPHVEHHVFWFKGEISMEDAKRRCKGIGIDSDIVVCCNEAQLKSIATIPHYHVFMRNQCCQKID